MLCGGRVLGINPPPLLRLMSERPIEEYKLQTLSEKGRYFEAPNGIMVPKKG